MRTERFDGWLAWWASCNTAGTTQEASIGDAAGIAVNPTDPSRIYLATHHGLYVVSPDRTGRQLSTNEDSKSAALFKTIELRAD